MNGKEQIRSSVSLSAPRRADPAERASAMIAGAERAPDALCGCGLAHV